MTTPNDAWDADTAVAFGEFITKAGGKIVKISQEGQIMKFKVIPPKNVKPGWTDRMMTLFKRQHENN